MRLLQINDTEIINTDLILCISEDEDPNCCWIRQVGEQFGRYCDRYSAKQLMSKICEEVYYGDDGICKEDK